MPRFLAFVLAILLTLPTLAQQPPKEPGAAESDEPAGYGLMLSPAVFEKILDRIGEKMAEDLKCDELQAAELRRTFKTRVKEFVKRNQADVTVLANQFIEATLEDEAPSPETVAVWAQRALPILDKAREMVSGMGDEMREFLNEDQMVKIDAGLAAAEVGFTFMNQKLGKWAEGGYDPVTEWPKNPGVAQRDRQQERELRRAMETARREKLSGGASAAVADGSGGRPAGSGDGKAGTRPAEAPKDEWTLYVERFIAKYDLDQEQQSKARLFLSNAQERRDNYLSSADNVKKIEELEKLFRSADNEQLIETAEAKYKALMAPVDNAFETLKEKLDTLPTRAQRKKALEAEKSEKAPQEAAASKP